MSIGKMIHRPLFQARIATPDGSGGNTYTWEDYYECWASIRPMKASRKLIDNQTALVNASEVIIFYNELKPISKELRMIFNGATYTISSVVDIIEEEKITQIIVQLKQ